MQIQSAKRNKNTSTRQSPFYKGSILIVKPSRHKCSVVNPKIDENSWLKTDKLEVVPWTAKWATLKMSKKQHNDKIKIYIFLIVS